MASSQKDMRSWLRSQGEDISNRGKIPDRMLARYYDAHPDARPGDWVAPLPGPGEDLDAWEDDMGVLDPDGEDESRIYAGSVSATEMPHSGPQKAPRTFKAVSVDSEPTEDAGTLRADPEPAHGGKAWRKTARDDGRPRTARVTAGIRKDINAKIAFAVTVPGSIWQARDPLCGGVFMEQAPEIAEALTDIVCDSPDLIAFFTGPGGAFMRYLSLGAALMPVAQVIMAHHVYHSIEENVDMTQPGYPSQYAA